MRRGEQRGHNGVGNLVFNDAGGLTFPIGVDDYLNVGYIGQRVQRDITHRPNSREHYGESAGENQKAIIGAPFNDSGDHGYMPPVALTVNCLVALTRPFCWAVTFTCHVPPEPSSPLP